MSLLASGLAACVLLAVSACGGGHSTAASVVLRGHGSRTVGPFTLRQDSDLVWSCARCDYFAIEAPRNSVYDFLPVNVLGAAGGTSFLEPGRFRGVKVTADGADAQPAWTITFTPANPRPIRSSYRLDGRGTENLAPFTLAHASIATWSCRCGKSFELTSDSNPLLSVHSARSHGRTRLPAGRYAKVSVTAEDRWTVEISPAPPLTPRQVYGILLHSAFPDSSLPAHFYSPTVRAHKETRAEHQYLANAHRGGRWIGGVGVVLDGPDDGDLIAYSVWKTQADAEWSLAHPLPQAGMKALGSVAGFSERSSLREGSATVGGVRAGITGEAVVVGNVLVIGISAVANKKRGDRSNALRLLRTGIAHLAALQSR